MNKKVLIVGGVAGGASTAARLRRMNEDCSIILFERGKYISFANCGLPYYIGGTISQRRNLLVQTKQGFQKRFNVNVRTNSKAVCINRQDKNIEVEDLKNGERYTEQYDYLVLSPGAVPVKPHLPGIDSPNIFTLRDVPDADQIKSYIDNNNLSNAVIIGGGFIGLEMAENLHMQGLSVTIVEMENQVLAPLDYEMACMVHSHLMEKDVKLILNNRVMGFKESGRKTILEDGTELSSDIVILSIGVKPESGLAADAGIETGLNSCIRVNKYLQTSDPYIFAIGDAVEKDYIDCKAAVYLAGPANKQGRTAADNIASLLEGKKVLKEYKGAIGTGIAKVFDLTAASTGLSEKYCKKRNISCISSIIHSGSNAEYYPGSETVSIKLVFSDRDGKILGAQAVGLKGADKRIDLIAAVINLSGTVYDLTDIEHAYAPPYSSAKDPVNIAGFVAENILLGRMSNITWDNLDKIETSETVLIDVRTEIEYDEGTIPNALNIHVDQIRERLNEIDRRKKIVVFCEVGQRAYVAYRILVQNGFTDIYNLSGGYLTYSYVNR